MPLSLPPCIFLQESLPGKIDNYSPVSHIVPGPDMGVFHLVPCFQLCVVSLLFLILTDDPFTTSVAARINDENGHKIGDMANSTRIPPPPQPSPPPSSAMARSRITPFKPGIAVIVGIITTIFSITFLLLLYVKHCNSTYATNSRGNHISRGNSGINRKVIESLPMFRFSSLRGQKDGLECAVCLNKFEPDEVLRLLPKCKHAFHVECVDTWLDEHSTCPLCRYRVDPEDVLLLDNSKALYNHNHGDQITPRNSDQGKGKEYVISGRHSSAGERGSSLEIIVENSGHNSRGRASFDSWNSRRKTGNSLSENLRSKSLSSWKSSRRKSGALSENPVRMSGDNVKASRKDGQLPVQGDKHRLEHRIIISDGGEAERRRWSDVQAAEILYLRSEMILGGGGGEEEGSARGVIKERSVSEITGLSRYRSNNGGRETRERQEEGALKRWLDWIPQSQQQKPAVNSATSSSSSSTSSFIAV